MKRREHCSVKLTEHRMRDPVSAHDPCSSLSCLNDGQCVPTADKSYAYCLCPRGYSSSDCSVKDRCFIAPCQENGGTCSSPALDSCFTMGEWLNVRYLVTDITPVSTLDECKYLCVAMAECAACSFSKSYSCALLGPDTNRRLSSCFAPAVLYERDPTCG
ncbi:hypothetical protein PRIPAC_86413 [Pristionchus pacificus]|uniref:Uncharacterized protein n=1 Tax=Pristionchus pacificus TaxID=54126 RepID=A0A2A6BRY8_PRIPA|nr:hypothetical protein PRIPAC_86413 [Pristionchus pacificus]|eukprot:PDM68684.1 hypothetical protein PRIPAC_46986 [Pristionchus pacificus]